MSAEALKHWVIFPSVRALQIPISYMGKLKQTVRWLSQNYKGSQPSHRLTKLQSNHAGCLCICWASSLAAPGVESPPFSSVEAIKIQSKLSAQQPANLWQFVPNTLNVSIWKALQLPPKPMFILISQTRSHGVGLCLSAAGGSISPRTSSSREEAATRSLMNLGLEQTVRQTLTLQPPLPCSVLTSPCGKREEKKPHRSLNL